MKQYRLVTNDYKLILYVAIMSFLASIVPALTAFQESFNVLILLHSLLSCAIGALITVIVQFIRPT
jgi:hypothetical protein